MSDKVASKFEVYKAGIQESLDEYGFILMGESVGDSALFSCLAYSAGAIDLNPEDLVSPDGKPVRHPMIWKDPDKWNDQFCKPRPDKSSCTPISKDMMNGITWCVKTLADSDPERAIEMGKKIVDYGRANKKAELWIFCTDEEVSKWNITDEDFAGKCVMTPQVSKDLYRVMIYAGWECDALCKITMTTGTNLPVGRTGFGRHLGVIGTFRNGLVEGALNDLSVSYLKDARDDVPNNALYQAVYNTFVEGDQSKAYELLLNSAFFPDNKLPTSANYCTDYLYQRDEVRDEKFTADSDGCIQYRDPNDLANFIEECDLESGKEYKRRTYNDDWLPCGDEFHKGRGVDWLFAAKVALGKVDGSLSIKLHGNK